MARRLLVALVGALVVAACSGGGTEAAEVLVLRNGTLIDGTGSDPLPGAAVVVGDGIITAIGPESEVEWPDGAEVIDIAGATILPGLIDTHTHHLERLRIKEGEIEDITADLYLTAVIRSGVTTFRDLGSSYDETAVVAELRAAIDGRGTQAPSFLMAGPIIASEGNWAVEQFPEQAIAVADAPAAAEAASRLLDAGVDQIKIMVENAEFTGNPTPSLTADQIEAITGTAHDRGAWVVAHVSDVEEAELALDGGVDELTHWPGTDPLPDELIDRLASGPTPVGTTFVITRPADGDVRRLLDAGGTIVVSSDAPGAMTPGGVAREMRRMVDAGMTPMEAILAATRDGARALEIDDEVGTVEVGKVADIVVVAGDPLADIGAMADVAVVVARGTIAFSRDTAEVAG